MSAAPALRYRLLSLLLLPVWILHALWQAIKNRDPDYFWQRLGLIASDKRPSIWIHASSVGEIELVKPLVEHFQTDYVVLVTAFTATGLKHARQTLPGQVSIHAMPIDFWPISRRFISRHRFVLGLVAETEIWPEVLYQAKKVNTPLLQINARLTAKSLNVPQWIRPILQKSLSYFNRHLTRTISDVDTLRRMGIPVQNIQVCGNLKYAGTTIDHSTLTDLIGRPYVLFASTHETEELLFAQLVLRLQQDTSIADPAIQLAVIAPRHPQRADTIRKELKALDIKLIQRSKVECIDADTRFYLADTLGELKALMSHARLVVMGGSFTDIGGHNILEPAQLGKAVLTGPSDHNIQADIELLCQHRAIIQVNNIHELEQQLRLLLTHPEDLQQLAVNALAITEQQTHVLENYIAEINQFLKTPD